MAYPSLLDEYAAVTVAPADLHALLRTMKPGNSRSLLSFLAGNLPVAVLGERYHKERIVRLAEKMWWKIGCCGGLMREVPSFSVDSAVVMLNARLKASALSYRVWRQCQNGDPRSSTFKPVAPYFIGLVDIHQPLALALSEGLRAVRPLLPHG